MSSILQAGNLEWQPSAEQSAIYEMSLEIIYRNINGADSAIAIDIGSSHGRHSYEMCQVFREVKSFDPRNSSRFKGRLSVFKNVEFFNFALGDRGEQRPFYINKDDPTQSSFVKSRVGVISSKEIIEVKPLDALQFEDIKFVKIDVEGYEYYVLTGARDTLKTHRPIVYFEGSGVVESSFFKDYFSDIGFTFVSLSRGWQEYQDGDLLTRDNLAFPKDFLIDTVKSNFLKYWRENRKHYTRWVEEKG